MTKYVAERSEAQTVHCDAALYDGWAQGDLIDIAGQMLIVLTTPVCEGSIWTFAAAPAREVGREAGSA